MLDVQEWELLLGFLAPIPVGLVIQADWQLKWKIAVALLITAAEGTVGAALTGQLTSAGSWLQSAVTVFMLSQAAYHAFWKPTTLGPKIEQIATIPWVQSVWGVIRLLWARKTGPKVPLPKIPPDQID